MSEPLDTRTIQLLDLEAEELGRKLQSRLGLGAILVALLLSIGLALFVFLRRELPPVRIGIVHSLTGTLAPSEEPVQRATMFAVDELNERGGVLGRQIEAIPEDGKSNPADFETAVRRLLVDKRVVALFGCWSSASRRKVIPVVKKHGGLLFYPVFYEGLEESDNLVYLGATANQRIMPSIRWARLRFGPRMFLVGSDYIFPHAAHQIIRDSLGRWRGEVVGEAMIPLGSSEVEDAVQAVVRARPDVIINTINGDTNNEFFKSLRAAGVSSEETPTLSFAVSETEIDEIGPENLAGDYAASSYLESLQSPENRKFLAAWGDEFGDASRVSEPMVQAYTAVRLWADAVEEAGTFDPGAVRKQLAGRTLSGPAGVEYVDPEDFHSWRGLWIGQIDKDGNLNVVWSEPSPRRADPWLAHVPGGPSKTSTQWQSFLDRHYRGWGDSWKNPGPEPSLSPCQWSRSPPERSSAAPRPAGPGAGARDPGSDRP